MKKHFKEQNERKQFGCLHSPVAQTKNFSFIIGLSSHFSITFQFIFCQNIISTVKININIATYTCLTLKARTQVELVVLSVFLHCLFTRLSVFSRFPWSCTVFQISGQRYFRLFAPKKINFLGGSLDTCFFTYQLLIDCYPVTYLFLFVFFLLILFQVTYLLKCHA